MSSECQPVHLFAKINMAKQEVKYQSHKREKVKENLQEKKAESRCSKNGMRARGDPYFTHLHRLSYCSDLLVNNLNLDFTLLVDGICLLYM